MDFDPDMIG